MDPMTPRTAGLSRRRLLSALIVAAGGTVLSACGQTSTPATSQPAANAQPTAAGAEAKPTGVSGGAPTAPTPTLPAGANVVTRWIPWGQP